jgi:hypothetical protein
VKPLDREEIVYAISSAAVFGESSAALSLDDRFFP